VLSEPGIFLQVRHLSCRVSSRAARRPREQAALQARRGFQGCSLLSTLGRGAGVEPPYHLLCIAHTKKHIVPTGLLFRLIIVTYKHSTPPGLRSLESLLKKEQQSRYTSAVRFHLSTSNFQPV
jgi:hypothetical protein